MEQKATIYTYGKEQIEATQLITLLQPYEINCVVDCRPIIGTSTAYMTSSKQLKDILQSHNISYIPFHKHFGIFPSTTQTKRGKIIYSKAIQTPNFLEGIERIQTGIKKGFTICLIDDERNTSNSLRYTLIGQYLKDYCQVIHIYSEAKRISQEDLAHYIEEQKAVIKNSKIQAKEIGLAGEEIAGLYLINHGYQILDRNWNLHKGCELDIVATKNNRLHFIEVKTRSSDKYGDPQLAIDKRKMQHILTAIHKYLYQRHILNTDYQIDSIAIIYRNEHDYDLQHFADIRPDYHSRKH
ncbi:MAG: YraN family protein [Prevotellaceae bacterium]|nr:YraN family protein [Prevotellaceae bacterium]